MFPPIPFSFSLNPIATILRSLFFYAPRTSSITQTRGAGTPTITRATVATVMGYAADATLADGQTLLTVASGELRFQGARRVSEGVWSTVDADGAPIPAATLDGSVVEDLTAYLALHAETFNDVAWAKANSSVTTNAGVAPDGTTTAENLVEDNVNTAHSLIHSTALADNTNYIHGIFAKAGTRTWCTLRTTNKANQSGITYINLSTGAFGTVDALHTDHGSIDWGNGWYFCWVKYGSSAGATTPTIGVELATGNNGRGYLGDNASYATFWGAMGHVGEYPRSYMTTAAAAVTRNADVPDDQVSSNLTGPAGTVAFTWTPSHDPSGTIALCGSYVDASNYTALLHDATKYIWRKRIAGVNYDAELTAAYANGTAAKISLTWGASGINLAVDGTLGTAHANTDDAQLGTRWQWGADGNSLQQAGAAFKEMYLTPRTMSDAELQAITV